MLLLYIRLTGLRSCSFLHHFPYFGIRDEQDAANMIFSYESTLDHYVSAFGDPPAGAWHPSNAADGYTNGPGAEASPYCENARPCCEQTASDLEVAEQ